MKKTPLAWQSEIDCVVSAIIYARTNKEYSKAIEMGRKLYCSVPHDLFGIDTDELYTLCYSD